MYRCTHPSLFRRRPVLRHTSQRIPGMSKIINRILAFTRKHESTSRQTFPLHRRKLRHLRSRRLPVINTGLVAVTTHQPKNVFGSCLFSSNTFRFRFISSFSHHISLTLMRELFPSSRVDPVPRSIRNNRRIIHRNIGSITTCTHTTLSLNLPSSSSSSQTCLLPTSRSTPSRRFSNQRYFLLSRNKRFCSSPNCPFQ